MEQESMGKKISLTPRKKKSTVRKPKFVDEKYIGSEPKFDAAMSNEEIAMEKQRDDQGGRCRR